MKRLLLSLFAAFAAVPSATAAIISNGVLPDAVYSLSVSAGDSYQGDPHCSQISTQPGSISCSVTAGSTFASESAYPNVALSTNVTSSVFNSGVSSDANITYDFDVIGAAAGQHIPILIDYNFTTSAGGDYREVSSGTATLTVRAQNDSVSATATASCGNVVRAPGSCSNPDVSGTLSIDFVGGELGDIYEDVTASGSGDKGTASAFADPYIYVDPTYANAANYSVVVSQNIGNQPVQSPEPASIALSGAALLCVVYLYRRNR